MTTMRFSLGIFAALMVGGCFNTNNVKNGGLECGPNAACPDGFTCVQDAQGGHCWRDGTSPDAAGPPTDTAPVKSDVLNPAACTAASAQPPFGPFATCSPEVPISGSTCDPVCQSNCACDRRCVVNPSTNAGFVCETSAPPATFVAPQGTCDGTLVGSCAPGSVCIADDACPWLCYKTCRKDLDCPTTSRCSALTLLDPNNKPLENVYLCTPPTESCNPTGAASCGTPRNNFACVFMAGLTGIANTDATVCDCKTSHTVKVGSLCTVATSGTPDNCQPGAMCVDGTCRQLCDRQASGSACTNGGGCNQVLNSTRWGYCR